MKQSPSSKACRADERYVFHNESGRKLSNMAMLQLMRGIRDDGVTVHGFSSSFWDWAAEQTPREVVEACPPMPWAVPRSWPTSEAISWRSDAKSCRLGRIRCRLKDRFAPRGAAAPLYKQSSRAGSHTAAPWPGSVGGARWPAPVAALRTELRDFGRAAVRRDQFFAHSAGEAEPLGWEPSANR